MRCIKQSCETETFCIKSWSTLPTCLITSLRLRLRLRLLVSAATLPLFVPLCPYLPLFCLTRGVAWSNFVAALSMHGLINVWHSVWLIWVTVRPRCHLPHLSHEHSSCHSPDNGQLQLSSSSQSECMAVWIYECMSMNMSKSISVSICIW